MPENQNNNHYWLPFLRGQTADARFVRQDDTVNKRLERGGLCEKTRLIDILFLDPEPEEPSSAFAIRLAVADPALSPESRPWRVGITKGLDHVGQKGIHQLCSIPYILTSSLSLSWHSSDDCREIPMIDDKTLKRTTMKNYLPALARIEICIRSFISGRNGAFDRTQNNDLELPIPSRFETLPSSKPARFYRPRYVDQRSNTSVEYTRSNLG